MATDNNCSNIRASDSIDLRPNSNEGASVTQPLDRIVFIELPMASFVDMLLAASSTVDHTSTTHLCITNKSSIIIYNSEAK